MFKNVKESLVEFVIGDAILELLEADAPISHEVLLTLLNQHLEVESSESRREALKAAIEVIKSSYVSSAGKVKGATPWGQGNIKSPEGGWQQLNSDPPSRNDKKH